MNKKIVDEIVSELSKKFSRTEIMERRVSAAAGFWTEKDGSEEDFKSFCLTNYLESEEDLDKLVEKAERNFDAISGYMIEMYRTILEPLHLDLGEVSSADQIFADFNPMAHLDEDFFVSKIAFLILLNFPVYSLEEKNTLGKDWGHKEWIRARLADRFTERIPSEVLTKASLASSRAGIYISNYNIRMDKVLVDGKSGVFPENMKLISHWGLRDELKALYKDPDGMRKQEIIETILARIVRGEIPSIVINNGEYEWDPEKNLVFKDGKEVPFQKEGFVRYEHLKKIFDSEKSIDPYAPNHPTAMDRNFNCHVEIPESEVRSMLQNVLDSHVIKDVASFVSKRLGRPLRAFDIWYPGFRDASALNSTELDRIILDKYGDRDGFQRKIPDILRSFGFSDERSDYLASKITVEASRGAGHAMGAGGRKFNSHLRTRFDGGKMNYISYNVAIHELGHCVEQVFSLNLSPSPLMSGVPNTAFTEGFAFVFQGRDQEILGLGKDSSKSNIMKRLHGFWHCFELSGISLVCLDVWHYMYEHQDASPEDICDFVLKKSAEYWNKWYAPVFGEKDSVLLSVYSHMIEYGLYLPNYPLGEIIRSQIEAHLVGKNLALEMEKLCAQGRLTPDIWLLKGAGNPISAKFLISAAEKAIESLTAVCE